MGHPKKNEFCLKKNSSITYRKFDFTAKDGLKLKGINYEPTINPKGTILACHYLGGSKEAIFPFFESLIQAGFRVISFDFRNHGESGDDSRIQYSLENDFIALIETIKKMGIEGPFGIMGFSMGSVPALLAMHRYSDVKVVVVDSGPLILVKKYFQYVLDNKGITNPLVRFLFLSLYLYYGGYLKMANKTKKILKELKGKPVLFIHGDKDNIIAIENAELAFELLKSNHAMLWRVPNSRHLTNKYIKSGEYEKRVLDFFNTYLRA
nr:alpha/beta fold hydrolase [Pelosinus baikalensis]